MIHPQNHPDTTEQRKKERGKMISLYAEAHLSNFTLILYTFVILPFLQITKTIARILTFLVDPHHQIDGSDCRENPEWEIDLPVCRFQDLELKAQDNSCDEEMCSICLMEFQKEDAVNKLPRCGHVFHIGCLENWLDRCHFTCPLCRAGVLQIRSSSACKNVGFCVNL